MGAKRFLPLVLLLSFLVSFMAQADVKVVDQTFDSAPHQIVQDTTVKVLAALDQGLDPVKAPQKFVEQLSIILDPVVNFPGIARGVMGKYAKQASPQQVSEFAAAFKLGLVNTYGKGMSNFGNLEVAVLPPKEALGDQQRVTVVQEIRGGSNTNQVTYTMAKDNQDQGQWKMINVVINGINLGLTFRGQFAAAVEKNGGDLAKTIREWDKG